MWCGGEDWSESGEQVRLYQPTLYRRNNNVDPKASFVGGSASGAEEPPRCLICQNQLYLLVQLVVPKSQTTLKERCLQVYACNKATCGNSVLQDDPLCHGGAGMVICRRQNLDNEEEPTPVEETNRATAATQADWTEDATKASSTDEDNEWAVSTAEGSIDDLEAKLAAMEAAGAGPRKSTTTKKEKDPKQLNQQTRSCDQFPSFPLASMLEPLAVHLKGATDDDDVGMSSGSDDKIQRMLANYMAEEEDENILSALQGAVGGGSGASGKEKDERLSASERALLTFSDRLKRCPRQVLRYAYDGTPLWSIPVLSPEQQENAQSTSKKNVKMGKLQSIPACGCGAPRVFEFQVLPSLLHVLEVDKHCDSPSDKLTGLEAAYAHSGMNFGNIAVYTCSKACDSSNTEYVVVQDSVDEVPIQQRGVVTTLEPVVIDEGMKFDDEDDDDFNKMDDETVEDEDDDDDEGYKALDETDTRW